MSARWRVKNRSRVGAATMAIKIPLRSRQPPMSPHTVVEYPIGCYMIQSESSCGINLMLTRICADKIANVFMLEINEF